MILRSVLIFSNLFSKEFMQFFGVVFLITTTFVLIFKREKDGDLHESIEDNLTLIQTYKLVWQILKLKSVQVLAIFLMTFKVNYDLIFFNF